jgi:hypothetical protein
MMILLYCPDDDFPISLDKQTVSGNDDVTGASSPLRFAGLLPLRFKKIHSRSAATKVMQAQERNQIATVAQPLKSTRKTKMANEQNNPNQGGQQNQQGNQGGQQGQNPNQKPGQQNQTPGQGGQQGGQGGQQNNR